ncbi:MAG: hypothetical protein WDA29_08155 [Flavobacteriaceae bacterium]
MIVFSSRSTKKQKQNERKKNMPNTLALPVSMRAFQSLGASISPNVALCVRGRHAVGKSEGVYQIAKRVFHDFYKSDEWLRIQQDAKEGRGRLPDELLHHTYDDGLPVIERRLSQLTEGDIVGLPEFRPNERTGIAATTFRPCDWLMDAVEFPVVLFLDERNRALDGVKQAVFQLTDSKAFYGNKLHEGTRIIIAENIGDSYQVNQNDPAEVSRTPTVTLEPSVDEWLDYAKTACSDALVEFIGSNQELLEHRGSFEPNKKYPDRRAWTNLDRELSRLGYYDGDGNDTLLYVLCCSFVGTEAGSRYREFVANREKEIGAADILDDWEKAKKKALGKSDSISNDKYIGFTRKILNYLDQGNSLNAETGVQLAAFLKDCPAEARLTLYSDIASKHSKELRHFHSLVKDMIVNNFSGRDKFGRTTDDSVRKA